MYQYSTVSSNGMGRNERNEFVYENDSLRLVYNFYGKDAPVNITIHNKLQVPLYIDWLRSALILNDRTVTYSPNEVKINGSYHGGSYNFGNRSGWEVTGGHIHASASLPPSVDFMPPRTILTKNPLAISREYVENIPDTAFHRLRYAGAEGMTVSVKRATFSEETSPLRFRSFLTYMVGEAAAKPQSLEHSFYVSEIMNSGQGPGNLMFNSDRRGNQFYTSKANPAGVAVGTLFAGMVIVAVAAGAGN
jgi:hypothetical protein